MFQCFYDTEEFLKDEYLLIVHALNHLDIFFCFVVWNVLIISRYDGGDESVARLRKVILCSNGDY